MVNLPPWQLRGDTACLTTDNFSAEVDLNRPSEGVHDLAAWNHVLPQVRLFQLLYQANDPQPLRGAATERFTRHADLFARYGEATEQAFSPSVYWTVVENPLEVVGLRLIGSVQTDSLDAHPDLVIRSTVPAAEILRLQRDEQNEWKSISVDSAPLGIPESDAIYCLILRLPELPVSYVEMIHPADFRGAMIARCGSESDPRLELTSPLLTRWMEKGVILRARAQGLFVPRDQDRQLAAAAYREFIEAELPLTV